VFLPLYFALSGLKTDVSKIDSLEMFVCLLMVCAAACTSKWFACFVPAWLHGLSPRSSAVVAVLMNTRGLMELIVLNLGIDCGVLNVRIFTLMVFMTLMTTCMTSPMVDWLLPEHERDAKANTAEEETVNELEMDLLRTKGVIDWCDRESKMGILIAEETELVDIMNVVWMLAPTIYPYSMSITAYTYDSEFMSKSTSRSVGNSLRKHMDAAGTVISKTQSTLATTISALLAAVGVKFTIMSADMTNKAIRRSANLYVGLNMPKLILIPWKNTKEAELIFQRVTAAVRCPVAFLCQNGDSIGASTSAAAVATNAIKRIVVLISGCHSDVYVISIAQYIAVHHPTISVHLVVCRGITEGCEEFDPDVSIMIEKLKYILQAELISEMTIHDFTSPAMDVSATLIQECRMIEHDAVICGFRVRSRHCPAGTNPLMTVVSDHSRVTDSDIEAPQPGKVWSPLWSAGVGSEQLGSVGLGVHRAGERCLIVLHGDHLLKRPTAGKDPTVLKLSSSVSAANVSMGETVATAAVASRGSARRSARQGSNSSSGSSSRGESANHSGDANKSITVPSSAATALPSGALSDDFMNMGMGCREDVDGPNKLFLPDDCYLTE
jgi:hypothetical protein